VTGAITFASHSLISEKLGRSLEPLLATPITTFELLVGKVGGALIPSLGVMLLTFGLYLAGVAALAEPGVASVLVSARTLLLVLGVGPLASLVALQVGVLVSARANDPRTAQQFGALLILPLTALFLGQMTGMVVLTLPFTLLLMLGLAAVWGLLVLLGVAVFDRETILTRWR
jgi:ABC-2 type transport system permease protein